MGEPAKIAERWRGAYSVWTRSDMQGHEVVTSTAAKLVEELSAAETALALAKAERDRQHEFNVGLILRIAVLESKLAQEKEENARLKAPVSDAEWYGVGVRSNICSERAKFDAIIAARSKAPDGAQEAEG